MFVQHIPSGAIVEVLTLMAMADPCQRFITGRFHADKPVQDPETFPKSELIFPSGEPLPLCWVDTKYQNNI